MVDFLSAVPTLLLFMTDTKEHAQDQRQTDQASACPHHRRHFNACAGLDCGVVYQDEHFIGNDSSLKDSDTTVSRWLKIWGKDFLGNVKQGTADNYEMLMRVHVIPTLGEIKLTDMKTPTIQRLYNQKLMEGLSPKTIKNIHGCLHKALDIAVKIDYLHKNPSSACIISKREFLVLEKQLLEKYGIQENSIYMDYRIVKVPHSSAT